MQEITTKDGHKIEMYDAIDEMPMVRYHRYNQLLVIGTNASTDYADIRGKIGTIAKMIDERMESQAKIELQNLNLQIAMLSSGIDVKDRALAATIKSIDGVPCDDITADGLKATAEKLQNILTKGERDTAIGDVKKKIEREVAYYYPERDVQDHAMLNNIKRRLELIADEIIHDKDNKDRISEIDKRLLKLASVVDCTQYERESDVAFEQGCHSITEQLHKDAKNMTVMEFYAAEKMLEERAKRLDKITNKSKNKH